MNLSTMPFNPTPIPQELDPSYAPGAKYPTLGTVRIAYLDKSKQVQTEDLMLRATKAGETAVKFASFEDAARAAVDIARSSIASPAVAVYQTGDTFRAATTNLSTWPIDGLNIPVWVTPVTSTITADNMNASLKALFTTTKMVDLRYSQQVSVALEQAADAASAVAA